MRIFLLAVLLCTASTQADSSAKKQNNLKISNKKYKMLQRALSLPPHRRSRFFQKKPHYFTDLEHIFQKQSSPPSMKWKALMSMSRLHPQKTKTHINQALNSSDWFLKNAGLIALEIVHPESAARKASEFLDHPALMLRAASVELIHRRKAKQYKGLLWTQLTASQNFRKGKSLWIRYTIAQALSDFSSPSDQNLFFTLLGDKDPRIHSIAVRALQRINPLSQPENLRKPPLLAREKLPLKIL